MQITPYSPDVTTMPAPTGPGFVARIIQFLQAIRLAQDVNSSLGQGDGLSPLNDLATQVEKNGSKKLADSVRKTGSSGYQELSKATRVSVRQFHSSKMKALNMSQPAYLALLDVIAFTIAGQGAILEIDCDESVDLKAASSFRASLLLGAAVAAEAKIAPVHLMLDIEKAFATGDGRRLAEVSAEPYNLASNSSIVKPSAEIPNSWNTPT